LVEIMNPEPLTGPAPDKFSPRRAFFCALPFMLMGGVALLLTAQDLITRPLDLRTAKHLLTIVVVCTGLTLVIFGWFAGKRPRRSVQLRAAHPQQPWRWRGDWMEGRADNSVRHPVFFLWVFVVFFGVISLVAFWLVGRSGRAGGGTAWLGLVFPLVGLAVAGFAAQATRVWRRFGRASLTLTAPPVPPGGVLTGELRVPARLEPEHVFYLRLSCVRRTTARREKQRVTTERILWQDEKWFRPNVPEPEAGTTRLPVFFQLPAGLPESTPGDGDGVQWRLEASAKVSGPDFHGTFEVPVFNPLVLQPGPAPADSDPPVTHHSSPVTSVPSPLPVPDPTLAWQLTLDEVRQKIQSRIQVVDTPAGRDFIFPAGRNPGIVAGASVIWLIWTGVVGCMIWWRAPLLFALVFAAGDALMSLFLLDLWLRRDCVRVTPAQLKIQTSWLAYRRETVLAAADVASLKADRGDTAGHAAYYDLRIRTRNGREHVAAKFLSHKPEADWLLRQMAAVLKRG
jgi:hypothetical protein